MQENFKRLGISGEDDEFSNTTAQGFRSLKSVMRVSSKEWSVATKKLYTH